MWQPLYQVVPALQPPAATGMSATAHAFHASMLSSGPTPAGRSTVHTTMNSAPSPNLHSHNAVSGACDTTKHRKHKQQRVGRAKSADAVKSELLTHRLATGTAAGQQPAPRPRCGYPGRRWWHQRCRRRAAQQRSRTPGERAAWASHPAATATVQPCVRTDHAGTLSPLGVHGLTRPQSWIASHA
jgi:hypothetical protein